MIDQAKADRALRFISRLKHTKGEWDGKPFVLEEFQKKLIEKVFGTVNEDGYRAIRTLYIEIGRKNGKSEVGAAIALLLLFADSEPGAEIYSAAADKDQAAIIFNVAAEMVRKAPALMKRCRIIDSTKRIIVPSTHSIYRVLSADHMTKHGFDAHGVIFDELHTQPNRELWDVLTTSQGTRRQPIVVALTTAGYDRQSICWEQHEYAEKVRNGVIKDQTFHSVVYTVPKDDDWKDERNWYKANPGLNIFRSLEEMREKANKAVHVPALQNTFRRLYLNQWTAQATRWLDLDVWDRTAGEVYEEDLEGETAYGGLDLALVEDVASFVLVFPDQDRCFDVLPFFWVPEETVIKRSERDGVPYDLWVEQGYIEATPGAVIDYRYIGRKIQELGDRYHIDEIRYDRWGATQLMQELEDEGFTVVRFGQGYQSMSPPTKELLNLALARRIRHGGNPVLRWMADNVVVTQDPAGQLKPDKSKSKEKIDGIVATIMGLDGAVRNGPSIYETGELFSL